MKPQPHLAFTTFKHPNYVRFLRTHFASSTRCIHFGIFSRHYNSLMTSIKSRQHKKK